MPGRVLEGTLWLSAAALLDQRSKALGFPGRAGSPKSDYQPSALLNEYIPLKMGVLTAGRRRHHPSSLEPLPTTRGFSSSHMRTWGLGPGQGGLPEELLLGTHPCLGSLPAEPLSLCPAAALAAALHRAVAPRQVQNPEDTRAAGICAGRKGQAWSPYLGPGVWSRTPDTHGAGASRPTARGSLAGFQWRVRCGHMQR